MIAVLIANSICHKYQPSIYDSIIQMKKLPYLPDLRKGELYTMTAADIMRRDVRFVSLQSSYQMIADLLASCDASVFPLVDTPATKHLLGAVKRSNLQVAHTHTRKAVGCDARRG
eukprot:m.831725 g.831725  ORF g.831725 m.831725 type:complete len:115 (+) comp23430_c0_seq54:2311-2655(+)